MTGVASSFGASVGQGRPPHCALRSRFDKRYMFPVLTYTEPIFSHLTRPSNPVLYSLLSALCVGAEVHFECRGIAPGRHRAAKEHRLRLGTTSPDKNDAPDSSCGGGGTGSRQPVRANSCRHGMTYICRQRSFNARATSPRHCAARHARLNRVVTAPSRTGAGAGDGERGGRTGAGQRGLDVCQRGRPGGQASGVTTRPGCPGESSHGTLAADAPAMAKTDGTVRWYVDRRQQAGLRRLENQLAARGGDCSVSSFVGHV